MINWKLAKTIAKLIEDVNGAVTVSLVKVPELSNYQYKNLYYDIKSVIVPDYEIKDWSWLLTPDQQVQISKIKLSIDEKLEAKKKYKQTQGPWVKKYVSFTSSYEGDAYRSTKKEHKETQTVWVNPHGYESNLPITEIPISSIEASMLQEKRNNLACELIDKTELFTRWVIGEWEAFYSAYQTYIGENDVSAPAPFVKKGHADVTVKDIIEAFHLLDLSKIDTVDRTFTNGVSTFQESQLKFKKFDSKAEKCETWEGLIQYFHESQVDALYEQYIAEYRKIPVKTRKAEYVLTEIPETIGGQQVLRKYWVNENEPQWFFLHKPTPDQIMWDSGFWLECVKPELYRRAVMKVNEKEILEYWIRANKAEFKSAYEKL